MMIMICIKPLSLFCILFSMSIICEFYHTLILLTIKGKVHREANSTSDQDKRL